MANYDKPAFIYPNISKDIDQSAIDGEFEVLSVTDEATLAMWADMDNAFARTFGYVVGATTGYGYGSNG